MPSLAELWDQITDRDRWPPLPQGERAFSKAEIAALSFTVNELSDLFWKPGDPLPVGRGRKADQRG